MMAKPIAKTKGKANPSRPWEVAEEKQKAALRRKQIAVGAGAAVLCVAAVVAWAVFRRGSPAVAAGPGGLKATALLLPTAGPPLVAIRIVNTASDVVMLDRVLLNGEFAALAVDEREEASGFKRDAFPAELHLGNSVTVAVHLDGVPVEGELGTYYGKDVTFVELITSSGTRRLNVPPPVRPPALQESAAP